MPERHEIELALNSGSVRRVRATMDEVMGGKFWKDSYKAADVALKKHLRTMGVKSDKTADKLSKNFSSLFGKAAKSFGGDLAKASREGSDAYVTSMKKAVDRISRIQAKNDQERQDAVGRIVQEELKGLEDRYKIEKKMMKERAKAAKGGGGIFAGTKAGAKAKHIQSKMEGAGGMMKAVGGKMGGKMGGMVASGGAGLARLGAVAGPVGVAVAALGAAALITAKKMYEVQKYMKGVNSAMLQTQSASDLVASGFLNVHQGVTAVRQEFMEYKNVSNGWRSTAEESMQAIGGLTQAGVRLDAVLGHSIQSSKEGQVAARKAFETTMTYSQLFNVSVGEIGQAVGDMMNNLTYSFSDARDALALIDTAAQKSGISTGVFFSKVQSLNSQLGMMNANLGFQAQLLQKAAKGGLGFENSAKAAGNIMGKVEEKTGQHLLAYLSGQPGAVEEYLERALARTQAQLQVTDDPRMVARLEAYTRELEQALGDGTASLAEAAQALSFGLSSEADNMELRMRVFAKAMGTSFDKLSLDDLTQEIDFTDTEMTKALADLGGTNEEIMEAIFLMQGVLKDGDGAAEAIDKMHRESLEPQTEQFAKDIELAQDSLQEQRDIGVILTNIKEFIYSKLYDIMLKLYEVLLKTYELAKWVSASDQEKLVMLADRAELQVMQDLKRAQETGNKDEIELQEKALAGVQEEKKQLEGFTADQTEQYLRDYGGGSEAMSGKVDFAAMTRFGKGATKGELTGSLDSGLDSPTTGRTTAQAAAQEKEEQAQTSQESSAKATRATQGQGLLDKAGLTVSGVMADPQFGQWLGQNREKFGQESNITQAAEFAIWRAKRGQSSVALAEGGIVNRPTNALIGEAGPEAVIPLGKGKLGSSLTINFYGGVWNEDQLTKKLQEAFRQFEQSQRI